MSAPQERQAASLSKLAKELGADIREQWASTGSIYLHIDHERGSCKIRVADHADAYATSGYSVDPAEGTARGARAFLLRQLHTSEAAIRRLRRARKSARARKAASCVVYDADSWIIERDAFLAAYAQGRAIS